jgi:hypothetical protein
MTEHWKDVVGYEGLYQVSNMGNVRSLDRVIQQEGKSPYVWEGRMLSPASDRYGYKQAHFLVKGERKHPYVHRMVAEAFIPNPNGYKEVNHMDENPGNNRVDNLEWCDRVYNVRYGTGQERRAAKIRRPIIQKDLSGNVVHEWGSLTECQRETWMLTGHICRALKHYPMYDTAYGYIWEYADT